jgi:Domain of unknown function (DUF4276)
MTTVVPIVEGHGEVEALPILLRRMGAQLTPSVELKTQMPIRVKRDRFLNENEPSEFNRIIKLAAQKCDENGWILILLDADDDCPAELGAKIYARAKALIAHKPISVVLANREYEAWFLAAATSLDGQRGFSLESNPQAIEPESIRGAKEWMGARMVSGKYRETTDQPAFSATMDISMAYNNSRSFRKLYEECQKNMTTTQA